MIHSGAKFKLYYLFFLAIVINLNPTCLAEQKFINDNAYLSLVGSKFESKIDSSCLFLRKKSNEQKLKLKNPFLAFGLSIFPGIVIRGLGHLYSGNLFTGGILMLGMLTSVYLISIEENYIPYEGDNVNAKKFKYYDSIYYSARILFFCTWAYDIIGAPIVCIRHNNRLQQKISMSPYIENNLFGQRIGIRLSYMF